MSKNKEEKLEEVEEVKLHEYNHVAIGIYPVKDGASTRYVVVEVPYDPDSGDTGALKEVCRDIREDAIDAFKRQVVERGFFGE